MTLLSQCHALTRLAARVAVKMDSLSSTTPPGVEGPRWAAASVASYTGLCATSLPLISLWWSSSCRESLRELDLCFGPYLVMEDMIHDNNGNSSANVWSLPSLTSLRVSGISGSLPFLACPFLQSLSLSRWIQYNPGYFPPRSRTPSTPPRHGHLARSLHQCRQLRVFTIANNGMKGDWGANEEDVQPMTFDGQPPVLPLLQRFDIKQDTMTINDESCTHMMATILSWSSSLTSLHMDIPHTCISSSFRTDVTAKCSLLTSLYFPATPSTGSSAVPLPMPLLSSSSG